CHSFSTIKSEDPNSFLIFEHLEILANTYILFTVYNLNTSERYEKISTLEGDWK
ncbi:7270_t:CDS:1, partial [Funneliformis geosporum]